MPSRTMCSCGRPARAAQALQAYTGHRHPPFHVAGLPQGLEHRASICKSVQAAARHRMRRGPGGLLGREEPRVAHHVPKAGANAAAVAADASLRARGGCEVQCTVVGCCGVDEVGLIATVAAWAPMRRCMGALGMAIQLCQAQAAAPRAAPGKPWLRSTRRTTAPYRGTCLAPPRRAAPPPAGLPPAPPSQWCACTRLRGHGGTRSGAPPGFDLCTVQSPWPCLPGSKPKRVSPTDLACRTWGLSERCGAACHRRQGLCGSGRTLWGQGRMGAARRRVGSCQLDAGSKRLACWPAQGRRVRQRTAQRDAPLATACLLLSSLSRRAAGAGWSRLAPGGPHLHVLHPDHCFPDSPPTRALTSLCECRHRRHQRQRRRERKQREAAGVRRIGAHPGRLAAEVAR